MSHNTLAEIIAYKRDVVVESKARTSRSELALLAAEARKPMGFAHALRAKVAEGNIALIAEIKKASPSKGVIRPDFNPIMLADAYHRGGATCLSVLTDERYFHGSDDFLRQVVATCPLPVLRKDFIIDPYQIAESRALGADCVLLIMAALEDAQARELEQAALAHGMDVLVEVHDAVEMERALTQLASPLLGINNRNLKTLEVSLETSVQLMQHMPPEKLPICESGIITHADIIAMRRHGMHCFLVGESLMRQMDVEQATKALLGQHG
jgi:indole-3-glycerol phosphate synthase